MGLKFRNDSDLTFLKSCDNDDLEVLVHYLVYGTDQDKSERLTSELLQEERYARDNPNHHVYWDLIAAELQCFGGNTFATICRGGEGVLYREILIDVCKKCKVNFNSKSPTKIIELALLSKILMDSIEKMTAAELQATIESMDISFNHLGNQAMVAAIQTAIAVGKFQAYQIAVIVANAVSKQILGHGLRIASNAAITRTLSIFAGPIGWAITAIWTLVDIAGPAFRVTVPAVIHVAYLRTKYDAELCKAAPKSQATSPISAEKSDTIEKPDADEEIIIDISGEK